MSSWVPIKIPSLIIKKKQITFAEGELPPQPHFSFLRKLDKNTILSTSKVYPPSQIQWYGTENNYSVIYWLNKVENYGKR